MKLRLVTKIDKSNKAMFFQFVTNLEQFGSWIPGA